MIKPEYIKRFDNGGIIDTSALLNDVKKDVRFFRDGAYTKSGKQRLAAIQEISDNQQSGISYKFNDQGNEFTLVDKSNKPAKTDVGHGVEVEKKITPLYGLFNNEKRSKKEVSKVLSDVSKSKYAVTSKPSETHNDDLSKAKAMSENAIKHDLTSKYYTGGYTDPNDISRMSGGMVTPEEATFHLKAILSGQTPKTSETPKVKEELPVDKSITKEEQIKKRDVANKDKAGENTDVIPLTATNTKTSSEATSTTTTPVVTTTETPVPSKMNNEQLVDESDPYAWGVPARIASDDISTKLNTFSPKEMMSRIFKDVQYESNSPSYIDDGVLIKGMVPYNVLEKKLGSEIEAAKINIVKLKSKIRNNKFPESWRKKQENLLEVKEQELNSLIKKLEPLKSGINKQKLIDFSNSFNPVTKAQYGSSRIGGDNKFKSYSESYSQRKAREEKLKKEQEQEAFDKESEEAYANQDNVLFNKYRSYETEEANDNLVKDESKGKVGEKANSQSIPTQSYKTIDDNKKDDLVKENTGKESDLSAKKKNPFLTSTGINTPIGEVQYNDLVQLWLLNKAKNTRIADVPVNMLKYTDHAARNVLAPRDMDYAMIKSAKQKINQIQSGYKGSDPVINAIMNLAANSQATGMNVELDAQRAQYKRGEEDRAYNEMEQHRQQAADDNQRSTDVYNTNRDRLQQAELLKAEAEVKRKAGYWAGLGTLFAGIQTRLDNTRATNQQMEYELATQDKNSEVQNAYSDYERAANELMITKRHNKFSKDSPVDTTELEADLQKKLLAYQAIKKGATPYIREEMKRIGKSY